MTRVLMIGTRGVPAAYGGFETAVEEIGARLAETGYDVTVVCRVRPPYDHYRGMRLLYVPAVRRRSFETLSHTAITSVSSAIRGHDVALAFNVANAPFLPLLRARGIRSALNVDGLEWERDKWGPLAKAYYRGVARCSKWCADVLIADSHAIADFYANEFGAATTYIAYGAPIVESVRGVEDFGLAPRRYHLLVARMEPENNVHLVIDGYRTSRARLPLVVVGSAPYQHGYQAHVRRLADRSDGVEMVGAVWDQSRLDALYAGAATYIHGHSVGGTNPSLLRAMGAGAVVAAYDVPYSREVLGDAGLYFADAKSLGDLLEHVESSNRDDLREAARRRVQLDFTWDSVAASYASVVERLMAL